MVALKIFTLFALTISISHGQQLTPRIQNGIAADTMRRFPHHVNIQPIANGQCQDALPKCSGSIIGKQWILTSKTCVDNGDQLRVDFQRLNKNNTIGSFSTVVNNDEKWVTAYPTGFDDLAMIRLPLELIYSPTVKPIGFSSRQPSQLLKKLAVLPGFDDNQGKGQLTYAMLSIAPNEVCQRFYGDIFDNFLNMCTEQNNRNGHSPSGADTGAGLVVGWPGNPELIGMYSNIINGDGTSNPSAYVLIEKYAPWIKNIMSETEDFITTTAGYYTK